jgi:RNA polymerase sigma factor (sigma-70 family)
LQAAQWKVVAEMTTFTDSTAAPTQAGTRFSPSAAVREVTPRRSSQFAAAPSEPDTALVALVSAARRGDDGAWRRLVERFDPMLRKVAGSFRLAPCDVEDVLQETWVLLYRHIGGLREPAAVAGWLATTVRRRSLRLLQAQSRVQLTGDPDLGASQDQSPETTVLEAEQRDSFRRAVRELPDRQRRLMTVLAAQPSLDYEQIGALLQMPVGSIGPTRARGLARLGGDAELRELYVVSG